MSAVAATSAGSDSPTQTPGNPSPYIDRSFKVSPATSTRDGSSVSASTSAVSVLPFWVPRGRMSR